MDIDILLGWLETGINWILSPLIIIRDSIVNIYNLIKSFFMGIAEIGRFITEMLNSL